MNTQAELKTDSEKLIWYCDYMKNNGFDGANIEYLMRGTKLEKAEAKQIVRNAGHYASETFDDVLFR